MMPESEKKAKSVFSQLYRRQFLNRALSLSLIRFISTNVTTVAGLTLSGCTRSAPKDRHDSFLAQNGKERTRPNFLIILCDNLGYGDIGCFGSKLHRTPNINRMAKQGMRFTDFYATSGVCTPSRASLMTGCYPRRINMHVAENGRPILSPVAKKGLHPDEITIAELLRTHGYTTACIGKWHLGDQLSFLPTRQGFDYYFGIPYSDDMTARPEHGWPPLPLMENEEVIEAPVDRNLLTKRYTEKAIDFIKANKEKSFFVYLSHAMPGSTTSPFSSMQFRGKSSNGSWGDSIEELDWSTGEILKALKQLDLDEHTLVVWASDNGAPRRDPPQGLNLPLVGWGYTCTEGGQRVPCIMRWPGRIPAERTCSELCTMMDLLPTFTSLAGTEAPKDRIIDGHNIWPLMVGDDNSDSPYEAFYYYYVGQIQAIRSGRWKLHLPLEAKLRNFRGDTMASKAELYDLKTDIGETKNLIDKHPDIVRRLLVLAEKARADLGDAARPGSHQRPAGMVVNPTPRVLRQ